MKDETMWCFRHSEEAKGPLSVNCYKSGYKGKCDVRLAFIYPSDEWKSCPCGCGGLVTSE